MSVDNGYECWLTHLRTRNSGNRAPTLLLKMWVLSHDTFVPLSVLVLSLLQNPIWLHIWSNKKFNSHENTRFSAAGSYKDVSGCACNSRCRVLQLRVKKGGGRGNSCFSSKPLSSPTLYPTLGIQMTFWKRIIISGNHESFPVSLMTASTVILSVALVNRGVW